MLPLLRYFLFSFFIIYSYSLFAATEIIRIGVLSHRGDNTTLKVWSPLADYLSSKIPRYQFKIIPLDFKLIDTTVASGGVDFLLVNPGIYVNMEVKYRVSRIVTLNKVGDGKLLNQFAGVAFTLVKRKDINSFNDLIGKRFIAVDKTSLGGYQMVWRELLQLDIEPIKDFSQLDFAGTHDRVVMAVQRGDYDAGTVRSGILEKMAKEGKINLADFKIISGRYMDSFPFMHSTRLYPEWPFSKLQHTPNKLAQQVAIHMLNMPDSHNSIVAVDYSGWTVPLDYREVDELFKELYLPPYMQPRFTVFDAMKKYSVWLILISIFLLILSVMSVWIIRLNRQLNASKKYLERQHDLILDSVCDGIYGVDLNGNCTFMNRSMEKITGWTNKDMIGHKQHQLLHHTHEDGTPHRAEECPVYLTFKDQNPRYIEDDIFWKKDGGSFPVEYSTTPIKDNSGAVVGSVVVFRDISEHKQAKENTRKYQSDLAHMARLNTMGEMASGIAHELNQPLTAIATSAYAAIQLLESGNVSHNKLVDILEKINKHAERSGDIIRHLRKLIRHEQPVYSMVNINELIDDVLALIKTEIKKAKVQIEYQYQQNLPMITCQPIQIDQVILNLCKNAIESMQETTTKHRILTIGTKMAGHHAIIVSIADTGMGIQADIRDGLFDPFITSKGEGMGLGLSISKGIIEAHHGNLYLASDSNSGSNRGSLFRFVLPLNQQEKEQ
ncbi:MAG: PhnD/SsuA/transferrin family substrate-binding protein [Pseudomonadota bacterium]